jgi:pantetheine-phosphate adenylyltransferase
MNKTPIQLASWLESRAPLHYLASPMESLAEIARRWCERQRHWHGPRHLENLVTDIRLDTNNMSSDVLLLAALYHDVIYNPKSAANEEESAKLLLKHAADPTNEVVRAAAHLIRFSNWSKRPDSDMERRFFELDTRQLGPGASLGERLRYETAIFREYQCVPLSAYRAKRAEFLRGWADRFPEHRRGVEECLELLNAFEPRMAVYPGSFNPFHLGHLSILRQAELVFDKVIVAVGVNRQKSNTIDAMQQRHATLQNQLCFHQVTAFEGLLSEFLDQLDWPVTVVRGVRDGTDLEAELRFARFLNELRPNTPVQWMGCEAELQHLSSSGIRELESFSAGCANRYVPDAAAIYGLNAERDL